MVYRFTAWLCLNKGISLVREHALSIASLGENQFSVLFARFWKFVSEAVLPRSRHKPRWGAFRLVCKRVSAFGSVCVAIVRLVFPAHFRSSLPFLFFSVHFVTIDSTGFRRCDSAQRACLAVVVVSIATIQAPTPSLGTQLATRTTPWCLDLLSPLPLPSSRVA